MSKPQLRLCLPECGSVDKPAEVWEASEADGDSQGSLAVLVQET